MQVLKGLVGSKALPPAYQFAFGAKQGKVSHNPVYSGIYNQSKDASLYHNSLVQAIDNIKLLFSSPLQALAKASAYMLFLHKSLKTYNSKETVRLPAIDLKAMV
jgi:hypothetical protein